jgi:hypothetical protein
MNIVDVVGPEELEITKARLAGKVTENSPTTYGVEILFQAGHRIRLEVNSRVTHKDGKAFGLQAVNRFL